MHGLFEQVLSQKDLSKAGDLFSIEDKDIESDLSLVLSRIQEIANSPHYLGSDNDQSVVEISITRVTSAIRETSSIEKHAHALVAVLKSCLRHNLKPTVREEDPPHAKIASDILSCIFLNYTKKSVMELALPVAVRFLQHDNKELSRNMSSYLSLAAIDNAKLLAQQIHVIIDSVVNHQNKALARVLPPIYHENKKPIHDHIGKLIRLIPECDVSEKHSLLQVCSLVAKDKPRLLEPYIALLCNFLSSTSTSPMVLQAFVDMAAANPDPLVGYIPKLSQTAEQQPAMLSLVAQILGHVGLINKDLAKLCVGYLISQLHLLADNHTQPVVLKEVKGICDVYSSILPEYINDITEYSDSGSIAARILVQQLRAMCSKSSGLPDRKTVASQTEGIVTVITIGNPTNHTRSPTDRVAVLAPSSASLHSSKNASTSTREIRFPSSYALSSHYGSNVVMSARQSSQVLLASQPQGSHHGNQVAVGSQQGSQAIVGSQHSSQTIAGSQHGSQAIVGSQHGSQAIVGSQHGSQAIVGSQPGNQAIVGSQRGSQGITSPNGGSQAPVLSNSYHQGNHSVGTNSYYGNQAVVLNPHYGGSNAGMLHGVPSNHTSLTTAGNSHVFQSYPAQVTAASKLSMASLSQQPIHERPHTVLTGPVTSVATISRTTIAGSKAAWGQKIDDTRKPLQTITTPTTPQYTEPVNIHAIPYRDAVQQFCEKHLDKIKIYMDHVMARLPIPIKAALEETKHKRRCRLHFICFGQGKDCLYNQNFFHMKTRNPKTWIHLMFLAIQARSYRAVSQQDPSVGNLKGCWDTLKMDSGNSFVRLVTSSFPSTKDQDVLLHELNSVRYFDVFEFNAAPKHWACFLCNHPEKATGLLQNGSPSIEGQLKEKKGRWKAFKRWKTRYFTLSASTITCSKKDQKEESLPVCHIQSVKAVRKGMRDIPKAFEIFTEDDSYIFKARDSKNAEKWVQCLQIAVARTQKSGRSPERVIGDFDITDWANNWPPKVVNSATTSRIKGPTVKTNTQTKL